MISVDDRHTPAIDVVMHMARELSGEQRAELLDQPDEAGIFEERELFEQRLEALWDEWQPNRQTNVVQRAQEMAGQSKVADDTEALYQLAQLMPDGTFEKLSMAEWDERREGVLSSDEATLVLFDRDFSAEDGRKDQGDALLAELQQASEGKPIWAGLLTHTVTPDDEHETYLKLGDTLDLHRTVVISKARISEGAFPTHLRLILLAPLMRQLVEIVAGQISLTHEAAIKAARDVLPVELESMVFGASHAEGVREVDTLLLLFGLIQRSQAHASVWDQPEIHDLTATIRCLGRVEVGGPVADAHVDADRLERGVADQAETSSGEAPRFYQRLQIYDDIEVVNRHHSPIASGDIFRDTVRTSRQWIVIAQPCDLMVRNAGERGNYPITHVVLAPLERERAAGPQPADFRLPYFDDQGRAYLVKLSQARYQRVWLLDFAVFREDGIATLGVDDPPIANLLDGWAARHAQLIEKTRELLKVCADDASGLEKALGLDSPPDGNDVEALATLVRSEIATDHTGPPFTTTIDPVTRSIHAGCQRVERLSEDYSRALLSRWGAHIARPVLPYDLTRQPG